MFRYVKLKNYKSLVDFEADFTNGRKTPKDFILIYGENGVGKSNLASVFLTLMETLRTKSARDILDEFIVKEKDKSPEMFKKLLLENFKDTEAIIKSNKTINSKENMVMEFGFKINNKDGVYRLEMDNESIVSEFLEYNSPKKISYDFRENKKLKLDDNIFIDLNYKEEMEDLLEKYWGKHSFLSLLTYENEEKKKGYLQKRISKELLTVFKYIFSLGVRINDAKSAKGALGTSETLVQLSNGTIKKDLSPEEVENLETLCSNFFTGFYPDIKQVYLKKVVNGEDIFYKLMFKKQIYNRLIDVEYDRESAGTKNLVSLIPYFMTFLDGKITIIDEIDSGIHDVLINDILESLHRYSKETNKGKQLIITTHNTMLLESENLRDCAYVLNSNKNGEKTLVPISSIERLHPNLNVRKRYLSGIYGGTPNPMGVDFEELANMVE